MTSAMQTVAFSSIEERALKLLGAGVSAESTAAALGVTPSRISQMLADDVFANAVVEARFQHLQKHNERDASYDEVEDLLLAKLKKSLPFILKPDQILNALKTINGAKRRGQSNPETIGAQSTIVQVVLPNIIAQKFTVNISNQVVKAGEQDLLTIQSGTLLKQIEAKKELSQTSQEEERNETSSQATIQTITEYSETETTRKEVQDPEDPIQKLGL